MKAIMVMFDTLNRHMLSSYGCDWTHTPNFTRLADKTVVFDNSYVGSLPCMPARRELMTGRYNFLHRSWGPLEPFDDALPQLLHENGVYSHLITDHQHYWEDGGGTYHTRYSTCEMVRGQEGDAWKGLVNEPAAPAALGAHNSGSRISRQDWINRMYIKDEDQFPQAQTFTRGIEFIRANHIEDNWFLQLETFDPHEPFFAPEKYRALYPHDYSGKHFDWPPYARVNETPEEVEHVRLEYAALLSMCDEYLGKVLDLMDDLDLWKDTMLIVNTDHGFLLGEHDWWAKCIQPFYNEVAHTPLFIWDPRSGVKGERRRSLVQTIDIGPTLLEYFGIDVPEAAQGIPLRDTIVNDAPIREAALFGIHGGHINCTDGRYVYMRGAANEDNKPLNNYTLMPTHMRARFSIDELKGMVLSQPFSFTKGVQTMKIPVAGKNRELETMLFDLQSDPDQTTPLHHLETEQKMIQYLVRLMQESDAPEEQYERMGLVNL